MFEHHLIKRSVTVALVIGAAGVPAGAAQAMYIEDSGGSSGPVPAVPSVASQVRPVASSGSSFQWGDAGIGAAGATVLLGVGVLGAGTRRRRLQRPVVG